jgi:type I restriction enzyme M protein
MTEWASEEGNKGKVFPSYARMLAQRGNDQSHSRYAWTVDFAERRAKAREQMQPLKDQITDLRSEVIDGKEQLKRLKKDKAPDKKITVLDGVIRDKEKSIRELEAQMTAIDAAVFDLKAVNPNALTKVDSRTPDQIIENIENQGRVVAQALVRLNALMRSVV